MSPGFLAGVVGQDAGPQAPSLHPSLGPFPGLCSWPGGTLWVAQPRLRLRENTFLSSVLWFSACLSWGCTFAE